MTLLLVQFLSLRFCRPPSTNAFDSRVVVGVGVVAFGAFLFFLATDRYRFQASVDSTTEQSEAEELQHPMNEHFHEEVYFDDWTSEADSDTDEELL